MDTDTLLRGDLEANDLTNGNLKHMRFYLCPECGNLLLSQENADISCCGRRLSPLEPQKTDPAHLLHAERNDGEWYITTAHCMHREHYISFVALLSGDTLILKKRYPEWTLETRLPYLPQAHCFGTAHSMACSASGCKNCIQKRAAPAALFAYCPAGITTRLISNFSTFLSECSISPGTF